MIHEFFVGKMLIPHQVLYSDQHFLDFLCTGCGAGNFLLRRRRSERLGICSNRRTYGCGIGRESKARLRAARDCFWRDGDWRCPSRGLRRPSALPRDGHWKDCCCAGCLRFRCQSHRLVGDRPRSENGAGVDTYWLESPRVRVVGFWLDVLAFS